MTVKEAIQELKEMSRTRKLMMYAADEVEALDMAIEALLRGGGCGLLVAAVSIV